MKDRRRHRRQRPRRSLAAALDCVLEGAVFSREWTITVDLGTGLSTASGVFYLDSPVRRG